MQDRRRGGTDMSKLISRMIAAIQAATATKTSGYDTVATVKRVEGNTAWVHIPGGVDETPAKMTINAKAGDSVQVRVGNGKAFLVGNATSPPTDDTRAIVAQESADEAAVAALKARQRAYDAQKAADQNAIDMANAVVEINSDIADLQSQIDGNITSWFYTVDPAMNLPPVTVDPDNPESTGWDTDEKKQNHVGDLYYNTDTGHVWRFVYQNGAYQWVAVQDSDVTRALELASEAKDTADGKRRVFITQPVPPYDAGDLWCVGNTGDILTCTIPKVEGQIYQASDWSKLNKYTDDSRANAAYNLADQANTTAGNAMVSANGKNRVYHQSSAPAGGTYINGDTWFDTDDGYRMYRYQTGTGWVQEQFGTDAIADTAITSAKIENAAITNAKIADGTIQNAKISTLDAGKITSGYLDAARIQANSLSIGKVNGLQASLDAKVTNGANISVLTNDGTYTTGKMASVTTHTRQTSFATAAGYVGISNDSWGSVTSFDGAIGDMVLIPFTITDRDNTQASMLCRVRSYSGTTLYADNLALMLDATASKYVTEISGYAGITVHASEDYSNFAAVNSDGMQVYKSGNRAAKFGEETVIGKTSGPHVQIDSVGMSLHFDSSEAAEIALISTLNGYTIVGPIVKATSALQSSGSITGASLSVSGAASLGFMSNASSLFSRTKHSFTIASIAAGGTSGEHSETLQKPGYYPVGIVGWKSGAGKVTFPRLEITSSSSGSATITYNAFNANTQASGSLSATVDILWVKTS